MINIKDCLKKAQEWDKTLKINYNYLRQLIHLGVIDKDEDLVNSILVVGVLLENNFTFEDIKIAKNYWKTKEITKEILWGFWEMIGANTPLKSYQRYKSIRQAMCIELYGLAFEVLRKYKHLWGKVLEFGTNYKFEPKNNKLTITFTYIKEKPKVDFIKDKAITSLFTKNYNKQKEVFL